MHVRGRECEEGVCVNKRESKKSVQCKKVCNKGICVNLFRGERCVHVRERVYEKCVHVRGRERQKGVCV